MQLQESFAPLVSFSSLSSVVNQQLLVTNEGRNLCKEGNKSYVKYIFVETFIFYYFGNSYLHFRIPSKSVGYKIFQLSDDYRKFPESYEFRGCYFSAYMKLSIVAR